MNQTFGPQIAASPNSRAVSAAALAALFFLSLLAAAHAQTNYQRLKSFGFPEFAGGGPSSALVEGNDGKLYGTDSGTAFTLNRDGSGYTVLHRSGSITGVGDLPNGLVEANGGLLFGTTRYGGSRDEGTIFMLNKDGTGYTVLHSFTKSGGRWAFSGLVAGIDGALYGTTSAGGSNDLGTVFKINPDGSGYVVLYSFKGGQDAAGPVSALVKGSSGTLYGTTDYGGNSNFGGGVFKLNPDGSGYAVLHRFPTLDADGSTVNGLIVGTDGALYGTTDRGGTNDNGVVFKLKEDGTSYTVLHRFAGPSGDGMFPNGLVEGNDGALYGTTSDGGTARTGTVFKLNKDGGGYAILRSFAVLFTGQDGVTPIAGLLQGRDGALYGTTLYGGIISLNGPLGDGTVFTLNTDGSGYAVLRRFNGSGGDGVGSKSLTLGSDGLFYGTTESGGSGGAGTVFKLDRDAGSYTILHNFTGTGGYGTDPQPGLIEGNDGAFYGTTKYGGDVNLGTVFKINRDGNGYAILHSFNFVVGGGYNPQAGLVKGSDGALYGTTSGGGSTHEGTVFKLNQDGTGYLLLHNFSGTGADGAGPQAVLVEGSDGVLYGTTSSGGVTNADYPYGLGTVFRLKRDGSGYMVLRRFSGTGGDGSNPRAGLVEGNDGALYGTTYAGGLIDPISSQPDGFGTVFKLNRDGSSYTVLRRFTGSDGDGSNPETVLVKDSNGKLYGTTSNGSGGSYAGTVFELEQDGSGYTVLRGFGGSAPDGSVPNGLVIGNDEALYGTTTLGGDMGLGTVFKLFSSPPQIVFADIQLGGPGVLMSLAGASPGQSCQILAATNLNSPFWQIIGTNTAGIDGKFQFLDTVASNYPVRFYRTAAQ